MDLTLPKTHGFHWRVILGIALLIFSYIFRVALVRLVLQITRRILPHWSIYIKELERSLLRPLSWLVFILFVWLCGYLINISALLRVPSDTIQSVLIMVLSVPLLWTTVCFCNYVTWVIIRTQGWNRSATLTNDDYSRVMIVTETISVVRFILIAVVVSSCILDELGELTPFNTAQVSSIAVIVLEIIVVLGGHTWFCNIVGGLVILMDAIIERQSHIQILHHQGIVERLHLQRFTLRKYDRSLVYLPNAILMENRIQIHHEFHARQCKIPLSLSSDTKVTDIRKLIQAIDFYLQQTYCNKERNFNILRIRKEPKSQLNSHGIYQSEKLTDIAHEQQRNVTQSYIAVTDPFSLEIIFYTAKHDQKSIVAEKTTMAIQIIRLLHQLQIKCQ